MSHKLVPLYIGEGEYYTRTDADNVIAEKNAEIALLQATLKVRNQQIGKLKAIRKRLEEANEKLETRCEEIYNEWKNLFEKIRGVTSH